MRTSRLRQQLPPRCPPVVPWPSRPLGGAAPSLKMAPPVSPTGSNVRAAMVKMAAVYLRSPQNLPLSNMAVTAQLLPPAAARICPQKRWCSAARRGRAVLVTAVRVSVRGGLAAAAARAARKSRGGEGRQRRWPGGGEGSCGSAAASGELCTCAAVKWRPEPVRCLRPGPAVGLGDAPLAQRSLQGPRPLCPGALGSPRAAGVQQRTASVRSDNLQRCK